VIGLLVWPVGVSKYTKKNTKSNGKCPFYSDPLSVVPHQPNFACGIVSRISFLISVFVKIGWKMWELWGVEISAFSLTWHIAYTSRDRPTSLILQNIDVSAIRSFIRFLCVCRKIFTTSTRSVTVMAVAGVSLCRHPTRASAEHLTRPSEGKDAVWISVRCLLCNALRTVQHRSNLTTRKCLYVGPVRIYYAVDRNSHPWPYFVIF